LLLKIEPIKNELQFIFTYIKDKFNNSLVYDIGTTQADIKNDIMVKWLINNSLGKKTKEIIKAIVRSPSKCGTFFKIPSL